MKELLPLTPEQLARAEERLRHPPPGSRIEAAHRFGVDLTLVIESLRRSPAERVRVMLEAGEVARQVQGAARQVRK
jgi:RecB family endonuclease NucS